MTQFAKLLIENADLRRQLTEKQDEAEMLLRHRGELLKILEPSGLVAKLEADNAELKRLDARAEAFCREIVVKLGVTQGERDAAIQQLADLEQPCPTCGHLMRYHNNVDDTHGCVQCALKSAVDRLQKAEADTRRLDWLESRKTEVHFWNRNGNNRCSFIEDWDSDDPTALLEAETFREAIDAAMKEGE